MKKKAAAPGTLGWRLLKARTEVARISQQELAERSGVSQKTISKLERGDQTASTQVAQLARGCGVSVDWLATETGEMAPDHRVVEQPTAAYNVSDEALEVARAFEQLSPVCKDHVRRQIALLLGAEANHSGRRRAVQHDVEIKGGLFRDRARKGKKIVR